MTLASTQCPKCYTALDKLFEDAMARLDLAGGMWNPWGDFALREDAAQYVEIPTDPIDAPFTVAALTAFMLTTAKEQLESLAVAASIGDEERQALGALLASRIISAVLLAEAYDIDLSTASEALPESATTGVIDQDDPDVASQSGPTSQSGDTDEKTNAASDRALEHFDCARTGIMMYRSEEFTTDTAKRLSEDLNKRMNRLVEEGANSVGRLRCETNVSTLNDIFDHLLKADLLMLSSPSADQRLRAARAVSHDALRWARYEPSAAPTISLLVEYDSSDEQQS